MKKIYFACSIRGGRDDAKIYADLVKVINQKASVLTEFVADQSLTDKGNDDTSYNIWKKDTSLIEQADAIIAEVSTPSLGVGYEVRFAEVLGMPILCLYRSDDSKKLSAMIEGSPHSRTETYTNLDDASQLIVDFIDNIPSYRTNN